MPRQTLAELKLPPLTIHDLRHLAASELIRAGVDAVSVAKILGHASPTTTLNIYAHAFDDNLRDAVNRRGQAG